MVKINFLVRFSECDPYGIASHPNYLDWLMECRIDYFRKCGLTEKMFEESNINLVIVRVNLTCKNSCTYGDRIIIETTLKNIDKKSVAFNYVAKNEKTNKTIFKAETVNFVANKEGKLSSFPNEMYNKIIKFDSNKTDS